MGDASRGLQTVDVATSTVSEGIIHERPPQRSGKWRPGTTGAAGPTSRPLVFSALWDVSLPYPFYLPSTAMRRPTCSAALGSMMVITPFFMLALTFSPLTAHGRRRLRVKLP